MLLPIFLIFTTSCLSHAFLLAQTYQPYPGEESRQTTIDTETFEDLSNNPSEAILFQPNVRHLNPCNPRDSFSKWSKSSKAKSGRRWDRMGDPQTIRYLVIANWGDTLPLEAMAFYSTDNCAEGSLAMVIRFFEGEDTAQIVQLTEPYVPRNLLAWTAIPIKNPDAEYSNSDPEAVNLATSMVEGSVFIPVPGLVSTDQGLVDLEMEPVYCTGLVHRVIFHRYNMLALRNAGLFTVQNLILRVRDQIRISEDPETRRYRFECIAVPQDGVLNNPRRAAPRRTQIGDGGGWPMLSRADYLVNSIVASDYPWDEGVELDLKRRPEKVVDDILDLDRLDGRQKFPTLTGGLKGAIGRLSKDELNDIANSKRYPSINVGDLDLLHGAGDEEEDPNVIILPRKPRKKRVETVPRSRINQPPGKLSKMIANLLGADTTDPFAVIGIDTKLLDVGGEYVPGFRKDLRTQAV
ncbi:hypothetical protein TWF481_010640 [Arthrobotrys musiformis]|uniref:Uncharacterized protein n=1 Tax=Arthrobotrys musiformis TaxID=47236 RepID=A0AAV9W380_9PEZI